MVEALGIETSRGNGNNVSEVFSLTKQAVEKINLGKGPQFIEFSTYRWLEHCGPNYDNDIGYRTEQEFHEWKEEDPLRFCEEKLLNLSKNEIGNYQSKAQALVDEAFHFAEQSPFPNSDEAYSGLFAD